MRGPEPNAKSAIATVMKMLEAADIAANGPRPSDPTTIVSAIPSN